MLIVETVEPEGAGARTGIQVEDHLMSYARQPLLSTAMFQALEENTFGIESVTVQAERDGQPLEFVVCPGKLRLETRPYMPDALLPSYEAARVSLLTGTYAEAAQQWTDLAERMAADAETSAWLLGCAGRAWEKAANWDQAIHVYGVAWVRLQGGEDTALQSQTATALGRCHQNCSDWPEAVAWYEKAGQTDGLVGREMWWAVSFHNLGIVSRLRGDLSTAQDYHRQALKIFERLAPDSLNLAASLNNLGLVARDRGDLASAQDYHRRALEIRERLAPDSLDEALSLNNLGVVASDRGDLASAQDYYQRVFSIFERLAPDSLNLAAILNNLGNVALSRGDLASAQDYHQRALKIKERLAPDSLDEAISLVNLGEVARLRGDLSTAQDYHRQALKIKERLAPDSLDEALSLNGLGQVSRLRGDLSTAQDYHQRALKIFERLAPDSLGHSSALTELGQTLLLQQQPQHALPHLLGAVQILEEQRATIHVPEARALLLAQHTAKYVNLIQCYLVLRQPAEAFATLERSRARSLLELLSERQLDLVEKAPSNLREQQRTLDQQREHTYAQLANLSVGIKDRQQVEALHLQFRDMERRQQELTAQMRAAASTRYASLRYPQPLSLADAQAVLEPGTLLLAYLVDEEQTFLFAVTDHNLQAITLPLGRKTLQAKVHALRDLLDWRLGTNRTKEKVTKVIALGRELYAQLIRPASKLLKGAQRLLLCPDGPLHILPFAALVTTPRGKPNYLGAERPLQSILSATLYAQSKAPRPQPNQADRHPDEIPGPSSIFRRLLALGDPINAFASVASMSARSHGVPHRVPRTTEEADVDEAAISHTSSVDPANAILAELQAHGLSLEPLPHTRTEVLALKRLFGEAATVKLGAEATKITILNQSADADALHIACHGFADASMPLSSGLVLSRSEAPETGESAGDNGLLQAWEIFRKLRLDAELVVLSACETGLGQEVPGEGLIGLMRAFQYAGARNLVVSLWSVNDASTSVFMEGFYGALQSGARKEEAMRAGIAAVVSDPAHPEWRAPYYWSAFVLIGSRT